MIIFCLQEEECRSNVSKIGGFPIKPLVSTGFEVSINLNYHIDISGQSFMVFNIIRVTASHNKLTKRLNKKHILLYNKR